MNRWTVPFIFAAVLLISLLSGCHLEEAEYTASDTAAPASRPEFILAVLPYISAPHLYDAFSPLASYLEDEIGKTVRIRTAADFDEFMSRTLQERYDLVVSNPFLYLTLHSKGGYQPIVADGRPFESLLIVPNDSAIANITDLKDKRVGLLPEKALAGHLLPVDLLKSNGLYKNRDYTAVVMPSFDVILTALLNGDVAAGAMWLPQYDSYSTETKARIRVLAKTDKYSGDPYAIRGDLPADLREAVQGALLRLNAHPERERLLRDIGIQQFVVVEDANYERMRAFADRNQLVY